MSNRPGGLTALAIINLIFGVLATIGSLFGLLFVFGMEKVAEQLQQSTEPADAETAMKIAELQQALEKAGGSIEYFYIDTLISLVAGILMFIAGIGYLGQKKFLGRTLGLVYGALALLGTGIGLMMGESFGIGSMLQLIYPVLTIALLLTVFKDDFFN